MTAIYGIKNCDTMKKAMNWLETRNIPFTFHDYKKDGVPENLLRKSLAAHGWEKVLNRRGTTWRNLSEELKAEMNDRNAIQVAVQNPSLIKRPLLLYKDNVYLGFTDEQYEQLF